MLLKLKKFVQTCKGDPVSIAIRELKLKTNQIVMMLSEPVYDESDSSLDEKENCSEIEYTKSARVTEGSEIIIDSL